MQNRPRGEAALRAIATYEMSKGLAVLLAILGVLELMHRDLHRFTYEWLVHLHIDPTGWASGQVLSAVDKLQAIPIQVLTAFGGLYFVGRFTEAWGLWRGRRWGEWFGALSGGIYIPFEVAHLARHPSWLGALVVLFNLMLVGYLAVRIRKRTA